jgi:NAD(P)-dependent dehydrogenase (short-subunit alcohol dehydrogenase family)
VADCNASAAEETVLKISQQGGQARTAVLDVVEDSACRDLVKRVLSENDGRCDVLVNNAGVGHVGTILTTNPEDLERLWQVNVRGAYFLSRAVLPAMIARSQGSIINLGSVAALIGMESRFAYTVSKHALMGMTRAMAMDHGLAKVRINCICPGRTQTPFVDQRMREYSDAEVYMSQMVAPHALKRLAQPWEIAAAALYLASDASANVTGSALSVDGGYTAGK